MSLVETRRHQMFPVLDVAQIETAKRFASGEARSFAPGEIVYDVGERHAPAWLVLEGTHRGGAPRRAQPRGGDHHPRRRPVHRRGQPACRTRRAGHRPGRPGGLHRPALRCRPSARARGRLGGARRDDHARLHPAPRRADPGGRRGLGAGRPAGRAGPRAAAGLSRPQRLSLHRAGRFGRRGRSRRRGALRRAAGGAAADGLPERHGAEAADRRRGRRLPRHHARPRSADACTTSPWSAPARPASRPRSMPRPRACRCSCSTSARSAARPARRRGSRTISAFRPASPARRWPGAPSTRR